MPFVSSRYWKSCWYFCVVTCMLCVSFSVPKYVYAAALTDVGVSLSPTTTNTSSTHTVTATTTTSTNLQEVDIKYSTTSGGSTKPAHIDLSGASLDSITGAGSGWSLSKSSAAYGILKVTNTAPYMTSPSTILTITLSGIINSAINDCGSGTGLTDTCYLTVITFDDTINPVDTGTTTYTVHEDAALSFEVDGVTAGETHNGVTSTVTTTSSSVPFGVIEPNGVSYATHKLVISTNAQNGYSVTAVLPDKIHGEYTNSQIDIFGALDATWTTPQLWSNPDGTTPNNNTGWFGANTSDTRVTGWSSGTSNKFAPLGTSIRQIAYSSGPDTGSTVYVSYALGINGMQPSDYYTGTILYSIQTNY